MAGSSMASEVLIGRSKPVEVTSSTAIVPKLGLWILESQPRVITDSSPSHMGMIIHQRLPNVACCTDRNRTGYDFEIGRSLA